MQDLGGRSALNAGEALQFGVQPAANRRHRRAHPFQHARDDAVGGLDEGQQQVLRVHLRVARALHELLGAQHGLLRLLREPIESHRHRYALGCSLRSLLSSSTSSRSRLVRWRGSTTFTRTS